MFKFFLKLVYQYLIPICNDLLRLLENSIQSKDFELFFIAISWADTSAKDSLGSIDKVFEDSKVLEDCELLESLFKGLNSGFIIDI
jgi:hypothetical protein